MRLLTFIFICSMLALNGGTAIAETSLSLLSSLSDAEQSWLSSHPVIKVAPDPDYPPIEYFDANGHLHGMSADYIRLLEIQTGLRFEVVQKPSWKDVLTGVKQKEIDVLSAITPSKERSEFLEFTKPLIEIPGVILTRTSSSDMYNSLQNLEGRRVAVVEGYIWQEMIARDHPKVILVPVKDMLDGLTQVSFGQVDAMIANLATASYVIHQSGIGNLKVTAESGYYARLAIGIRKDLVELSSILSKAVENITPAERNIIRKRWIRLEQYNMLSTEEILWGVAAMLLVVVVLTTSSAINNRKLRFALERESARLHLELERRRLAEDALMKSEQLFRTIAEHVNEVFWVTDPDKHEMIYLSPAYERIWGHARQSLYENPALFFESIHKEDRDRVVASMQYQVEGKYDVTYRVVHPSGTVRWIRDRAFPVRDEEERVVQIVGIAEDVSVLRQQRIDLEHQVDLRTAELKREVTERKQAEMTLLNAKQLAEKESYSKSEFILNLSQELHTPLSAIIEFAKGLDTKMLDAGQLETVQHILDASNHLLVMINVVLDLSRIESGAEEICPAEIKLEKVIEEAGAIIKPVAKEKGITLQLECPDSMTAYADSGRLQQVVINLLSNAVKYNTSGGKVHLYCKQSDGVVRICVKDTGPGLAVDQQQAVFKPFNRASVENSGAKGAGMGLTLCKRIVEKMHGTIGVDSFAGNGCTFWIELPQGGVVASKNDIGSVPATPSRRQQSVTGDKLGS